MFDFAHLAGDSLTYHNGEMFSTKDRENDHDGSRHCSQEFKGAWWYKSCYHTNLNGVYRSSYKVINHQGIEWISFHYEGYSMKKTEMKIRPTDFFRQ